MRRSGTSLLAAGEHMVWLTGGALAICLVMIAGLLGLVAWQGATTFWPRALMQVTLQDGRQLLGEGSRSETVEVNGAAVTRHLLRTGNFEVTGTHFEWYDATAAVSLTRPSDAVLIERRDWGRFYGFPDAFLIDGTPISGGATPFWDSYDRYHEDVSNRHARKQHLQKHEFGQIHAETELARLDLARVGRVSGEGTPEYQAALRKHDRVAAKLEAHARTLSEEIRLLDAENSRYVLSMRTIDGTIVTVKLVDAVRAFAPNRLSVVEKIRVYLFRWREFIIEAPRSANSEGGVWPAIVGTVIMTLLMSVAVVPFGVLAALYLREYAKEGPIVSAVRIAVNNLAGVPSIVFGVFGLGFFCYIVGGNIDSVFFSDRLPNPTYGKGGVLWASLTLALLTLPVVVVATEEALAAVPRSMREGSYACGASKWQTIRRIVLPRAMPGIMTGFILAMARGAGEVAPLMLVGAAKLAPELPLDGIAPFLHPERSFMHLGFHIYDVGFQSQNSEAARPMVYTTTLLLITIIFSLNLVSVQVRSRLRRRFAGGKF